MAIECQGLLHGFERKCARGGWRKVKREREKEEREEGGGGGGNTVSITNKTTKRWGTFRQVLLENFAMCVWLTYIELKSSH